MLKYCLRKIVVNNVLGIVIVISPKTLTSEDQQRIMYSHYVEVQLVEGRFYSQQLLFPSRKQSK